MMKSYIVEVYSTAYIISTKNIHSLLIIVLASFAHIYIYSVASGNYILTEVTEHTYSYSSDFYTTSYSYMLFIKFSS